MENSPFNKLFFSIIEYSQKERKKKGFLVYQAVGTFLSAFPLYTASAKLILRI